MVSIFREPFPDVVRANPGGADDPLGESILDLRQPAVRLFEPTSIAAVLGRHQDPHRELVVSALQTDGRPIYRRVAGGGAVVLAPGMLVVALRLPRQGMAVDAYFTRVNAILTPVIQQQVPVAVATRGHGDLALRETDGVERKILGASLRQSRDHAYYLGVLLVDDATALMRRYLAFPSREPDYRQGRDHAAFCTHLGRYGLRLDELHNSLCTACQQALSV